MPVTEREKQLLNITADLWNTYLKLPIEHSDDTDTFRGLIHQIQSHILMRSARREINPNMGHGCRDIKITPLSRDSCGNHWPISSIKIDQEG